MSMRDVLLVNGDVTKPLDELIKELLNNGDHGLAALKVLLNNTSKEASVEAVKALLENTGYGLSALNSDLDSIAQGVNNNTTHIGNVVNSLSSAHTKLDTAINTLNAINQTVANLSTMGAVKKVQRGILTEETTSVTKNDKHGSLDITVSRIDPDKSIILCNWLGDSSDGDNNISGATIINNTTIRIYSNDIYGSNKYDTGFEARYHCVWQLIEFN